MFIKEYISKDYPVFSETDAINEALELAKDFGYTHIFVSKNEVFAGALRLAFLEAQLEGNLGMLSIHYDRFAMLEDSNILDTIKLFNTFNSNVIPIIDKSEKYLGYVCSDDVFSEFSKYPLFSENGAILTVQTTGLHYSMTEITKIVESNNSKIYGLYISDILEDSVNITMKISSDNLTSIDETFERFGYHILHKHYEDDKDSLLKDRFGFLQKYIEF